MMRWLMVMGLLLTAPGCGPSADARADEVPEAHGGPAPGAAVERIDLTQHFAGSTGSFVLLDGQTGAYRVHGVDAAATRHLPASTFKIPNTLIALETGVVADIDEQRVRDPGLAPERDWWPRAWLQPHSIRSGFQTSTVWFYQALAREITELRMLDWLHRLDYGNASIDGGIDLFWLDGGLRISGFEQVAFLQRFHEGALPVSDSSRLALRELLVLESGDGWVLSGKTGWTGVREQGDGVGWLVGYVERGGQVHYFATRIDVVEGTDAAERMRITRAALAELLGVG